MAFTTIVRIEDLAAARVLVAALKAHGFHPLEGGEGGLPGVSGPRGLAIEVPEEEAQDAAILARALLADMGKG